MAERVKALALLLPVQILVAAMKGKKVWNMGKPYVPQHIDGRPVM